MRLASRHVSRLVSSAHVRRWLSDVASETRWVRIEQGGRTLGGDFYNEPEERAWNPRETGLYFDFRILHDVADIERVVRDLGDTISVAHLNGALTRLRQLRARVDEQFLQYIVDLISKRKSDFFSRNFSSAWLTLARLGYADATFLEQLAKDSLQGHFLYGYTPVDVSNIIYAIGLMQKTKEQRMGMRLLPNRPPGFEVFPSQKAFLKTMVEQTVVAQHPARLNEVQIVGIMHGLALAKFDGFEALTGLFNSAVSSDRLSRYTEGELANLLQAMTLLGVDKKLTEIVVDEVTHPKRLKRLSERDLSCVTYTLRLLQFDGTLQLNRLQQEITHTDRLRYLSEQSISMILSNLRFLSMKEAAAMGPLLKELASERLCSKIPPTGAAMALYNYASGEFRDDAVFDALLKQAMHHIKHLTPNDISNIMFALSFVNYQDDNNTLEPLKERLKDPETIKGFEPGHILNVFHGSGKLKLAQSLPYSLEEVMKPAKIHRLTATQFTNVLYGLGQVQFDNHRKIDDLLNQIFAMDRIKEFTSNQLATVVSSLGKCGYENVAIVKKIVENITKKDRIRDLSEIGLMTTMHGLAGCGFRQAALLGAVLCEVILPSRLAAFTTAQLAIIVYDLGKIGVEDSRVLNPLLGEVMKEERINEMEMQQLTNVLYGLSQLHQLNEEIWERLTAEIRKPERLNKIKALEISLVLYAYGMKKLNKPALKDIANLAKDDTHVKNFSTLGLASTIYSLAQLEMDDSECIGKLAKEFTSDRHLKQATPHHLANVVYSLGLLDYQDKDVTKSLASEAFDRISSFPRRSLYNLLFGFCRMKHGDQSLLEALWKEMLKLERLVGYSEREWATIAQCFAVLNFKEVDYVINVRSKILEARGLPTLDIPRFHSKHELTPHDVKTLRDMQQNTLNKQRLAIAQEAKGGHQGVSPAQRRWLNEKNTVEVRGGLEDFHKKRLDNWRDRSNVVRHEPRNEADYTRGKRPIGPKLHPQQLKPREDDRRHRSPKTRVRYKAMIFNQTSEDISDDEMPTRPAKTGETRERIITPWQSPFYNLRVVQWPKSAGPAKVVNDDFDDPSLDAHNPYDTLDEDENDESEDDEFSIETATDPLPPVVREPRMSKATTFRNLMKEETKRISKKDREALDEMVSGLQDLSRKVDT